MNISLNLNQMLFSNLHVGTNINSFDTRLKGILLGLRKKTTILNLKISILQLQLLSHLIINLISKRQSILLIKEWTYLDFNDYIKNELHDSLENLLLYQQKWIGGLLTNHKSVFFSTKFKNEHLFSIRSKKRFPSLVCFFNPNLAKWALLESYNLKVPLSALVDSDSNYFDFINYPIISNNKSINSSLLYLSTICNSVKYGRKKEVFRVLSISNSQSKHLYMQKGMKKNIRRGCKKTLRSYIGYSSTYKKMKKILYKKYYYFTKKWKKVSKKLSYIKSRHRRINYSKKRKIINFKKKKWIILGKKNIIIMEIK